MNEIPYFLEERLITSGLSLLVKISGRLEYRRLSSFIEETVHCISRGITKPLAWGYEFCLRVM